MLQESYEETRTQILPMWLSYIMCTLTLPTIVDPSEHSDTSSPVHSTRKKGILSSGREGAFIVLHVEGGLGECGQLFEGLWSSIFFE